jgi:hydrogenase/urease accessory protein HupE
MKSSFLLAALAVPASLLAHPGHGETDGFSIIHYFTEPMHAIIAVGLMVTVYAGIRFLRSKKEKS